MKSKNAPGSGTTAVQVLEQVVDAQRRRGVLNSQRVGSRTAADAQVAANGEIATNASGIQPQTCTELPTTAERCP